MGIETYIAAPYLKIFRSKLGRKVTIKVVKTVSEPDTPHYADEYDHSPTCLIQQAAAENPTKFSALR